MDLIFQFLRIMVFCFAGELCYNFLPLPIPASVYGLLLLLAALKLGWVKLEQVRTAALFLIGIFPLLFVPAAAGVMDLWAGLHAMLLPVPMPRAMGWVMWQTLQTVSAMRAPRMPVRMTMAPVRAAMPPSSLLTSMLMAVVTDFGSRSWPSGSTPCGI